MKLQKVFFCITLLFMATSCAAPDFTVPKSRYNAEDLSKRWRSNVSDSPRQQYNYPAPTPHNPYGQNPTNGNAPYQYPSDNDEDYVAPIYKYNPPQQQAPRPAQPTYQRPPATPVYNAPYPKDDDDNYSTGYPTYNPDEDNSGYYYINKDKKLPPPKPTPAPTQSPNTNGYNYPIYFD